VEENGGYTRNKLLYSPSPKLVLGWQPFYIYFMPLLNESLMITWCILIMFMEEMVSRYEK